MPKETKQTTETTQTTEETTKAAETAQTPDTTQETTQDTSTPEEDTTLGEEEDFSYLTDEDEVDAALKEEEEEEGKEKTAAEAEPTTKPETAKSEEEQQTEPDKPAEKTAQQEQTEEEKKTPAEPETSPEPKQEDIETQFKDFFEKSVTALEPVYKLSEEEAEALDATPSEAVPKLAARLHMQVLTAATTQMVRMMPQMMEHFGNQRSAWDKTEQEFYDKYPALKKQEYSETVERIAWAYRQQNPKTPEPQAMDEIAAMSMVTLQLPLEQQQSSQQETTVDTPPPAPGSARGQGVANRGQTTKNEWEELMEIED